MMDFLFKNRLSSAVKLKYIISISILGVLLGYEIIELFVEGSYIDNLTSFNNNFLSNPGTQFFFRHNISFFLMMSILPFINIPIFIIQMIISGMYIRLIVNLPLNSQIEIFYRHFIFELMALLVSIYLSGILYTFFKKMHKNRECIWKTDLVYIAILYIIIILLTITAAWLEGGAFA